MLKRLVLLVSVVVQFPPIVVAQDEYGSMYVDDALVHYIQPAEQLHGVPVIMVPGLNLSSYIFLTTPDGRDGWGQLFAADGFDVYVINDPDFDFVTGGFSVSPFTVPSVDAPAADPDAEKGWQRDIWRRWGFGSSEGNPYPDCRFPTDDFAAFAANYPYVSSAGRNYSDAIVSLLETTGPAILVAHSAGGSQVVAAATARPDLVVGLVLVEPTGPPDAADFPTLAGMSMFGLYGDYIASRNQGSRKAATEAAADLFAQNGGAGEVISLPDDLAVFGNTHLMMQDANNAFIAALVTNWLSSNMNTQPMLPGDADGDCDVDLGDLAMLLGNFGVTGAGIPGDVDGDGDVDLGDLGVLLAYFGATCLTLTF